MIIIIVIILSLNSGNDLPSIFSHKTSVWILSNKALIPNFKLGTPEHLHKFPGIQIQVAFRTEFCLYNILEYTKV